MLKKILCTALLASSSLAAHATPQMWNFTYTGFHDYTNDQFLPTHQLSGSFIGDDRNHDGTLTLGELSSLEISGINYVTCASGNTATQHCGAANFSFQAGGPLNFYVFYNTSVYNGSLSRTIYTGNFDMSTTPNPFNTSMTSFNWNAQTSLQVSQVGFRAASLALQATPVPEPDTYAMLGLGLLVCVGLQRRRA